jgi:hypothetical protein
LHSLQSVGKFASSRARHSGRSQEGNRKVDDADGLGKSPTSITELSHCRRHPRKRRLGPIAGRYHLTRSRTYPVRHAGPIRFACVCNRTNDHILDCRSRRVASGFRAASRTAGRAATLEKSVATDARIRIRSGRSVAYSSKLRSIPPPRRAGYSLAVDVITAPKRTQADFGGA